MTHKEVVEALIALDFNYGWVVSDGEIVVWEHEKPQPSQNELKAVLK